MTRFVEIDSLDKLAVLTIQLGDVVLLRASGARLPADASAIELLGVFQSAVVGDRGEVLTPCGSPNTALLRAVSASDAEIDVMLGDPWHAPKAKRLRVVVTPRNLPSAGNS